MQELEFKKVSYWVAHTDGGDYRLSDDEIDILMEAEKRNFRIVRFRECVINVAFLKSADHHSYSKRETEFDRISDEDRRYIVGSELCTIPSSE